MCNTSIIFGHTYVVVTIITTTLAVRPSITVPARERQYGRHCVRCDLRKRGRERGREEDRGESDVYVSHSSMVGMW